jgi:hypothetical protein
MKTQLKRLVRSIVMFCLSKTVLLPIVLCFASRPISALAQSGNAVFLNGSTDYISLGTTGLPLGSSPRTIEAWIKTTTSGVGEIVSYGSPGSGSMFEVGVTGASIFISAWSSPQYTVSATVNNGSWHRVAVSYNGTAASTYMDGTLLDTRNIAFNTVLGSANIGCRISPTEYFSGTIDEVRIWNVARTQSQIQSTMNTTLVGNESGLVAYYRLNESGQGSGITVQNSATATGATLNGTTVGTSTTPVFSSGGQAANAPIPKQTLGLWLRADTAAYSDLSGTIPATNGQTLPCWKDMSGNGYNAIQSSSAYQPTFITNAINGLPEVQFNGTGNVMDFGSTQIVTSQQFSIFVVGRTSGGSYHEFFSNWNNPNQGTSVFFGSNGSSLRFSDDFASAGSITQGTNAIFSAISDTANASTYVNGILAATKGAALATRNLSSPYVVGNQSEFLLNEWLSGAIVELLVYNSALTASARDSVLKYLQAKYATAQNPLPVELVRFVGNPSATGVELSWTTASEKNNAGFDIERSTNKLSFTKIGFVKGSGTTTQSRSYTFMDNTASGNVFYRLKQIDYDGKTNYSQAIEVEAGTPKAFALMQNYPNPFNPTTVIRYQLPVSSQITLKVYDVLGREVATLVNENKQAGNYTVSFDASKCSSGVYFYKLQTGNFVQTKRMMLVK